MAWTDDKNLGAWTFEKEIDKPRYNEGTHISTDEDPTWRSATNDHTPITDTHVPCGYWPRIPEYSNPSPGNNSKQLLIPVVRAYSSPLLADWVGFLVWVTGSIYDSPIMIEKDETDSRNWGMNDDWMARGIYIALHGTEGAGEISVLDKYHQRVRSDGLEAGSDDITMDCDGLKNGPPGFNVTEGHTLPEWNASSYADPWPGLWNHEFNGFELHAGYPDQPMIYTGPFDDTYGDSFSDSTNIQSVLYDWKDNDDPIWDEPAPADYGPMINSVSGKGNNYYYDDYIDELHLTPMGYDGTSTNVYCAKMHQLWGWGILTVGGVPQDNIYIGGSYDPDNLHIGADSGNPDYFYGGCDWTDYGGGGTVSVGGNWWILMDAWPGGIAPVFKEWESAVGNDWTREQYFVVGGSIWDLPGHQWGTSEVWEGKSIVQLSEYWTDYNVENGLAYTDSPVDRKDTVSKTYEQILIVYQPKAVFYHADGGRVYYDYSGLSSMTADKYTNDNYPGYAGDTISPVDGFSEVNVTAYYSIVTNGDNWECWSGAIGSTSADNFLMLANNFYWDHGQTGDSSTLKSYTWLNWYNSSNRTFESNMQDIPSAQIGTITERYQKYITIEGDTYYHNTADDDRSSRAGASPSLTYARKRFIIQYSDETHFDSISSSPSPVVELPTETTTPSPSVGITGEILIPKEAEWSGWFKTTGLSLGSNGTWDDHEPESLTPSCVVKFGSKYFMYYIGSDSPRTTDGGPAHRKLGVATSTDKVNWTKYAGNPIMTHSPAGNQEEGIFGCTAIVYEGLVYVYITAIVADNATTEEVHADVKVIFSTDGFSFSDPSYVLDHSNPNLTGYGDEIGITGVTYKDSVWTIYYFAKGTQVGGWRICKATGSTPFNFSNIITSLIINEQNFYGTGGDVIAVSAAKNVMFFQKRSNWGRLEVWEVPAASPGSMSLVQATDNVLYTLGMTVYLDVAAGLWYMYNRDYITDTVYCRTALVKYRT